VSVGDCITAAWASMADGDFAVIQLREHHRTKLHSPSGVLS
jgi:hypothetical protein